MRRCLYQTRWEQDLVVLPSPSFSHLQNSVKICKFPLGQVGVVKPQEKGSCAKCLRPIGMQTLCRHAPSSPQICQI